MHAAGCNKHDPLSVGELNGVKFGALTILVTHRK